MSALPRICASSLVVALVVVLAVGCGGPLAVSGRLEHARHARECSRVPEAVRTARERDADRATELVAQIPPEIRRVAEAARMDDATFADSEAAFRRALLLHAEVVAASAEVDCLADQLEDLQDALEDRANAFELTFTLGSIAVAALTGIIAGVIDLSTEDPYGSPAVQIAGGVVSAGLGAIAFFPPRETIELDHDRNLLRAVRDANRELDGSVSRFVLRLLSAPRGEGGGSPRDSLVLRWDEMIGARREAGFFGDGGRYDLDALALREAALEELETELQLVQQDVELLLRFLVAREAP